MKFQDDPHSSWTIREEKNKGMSIEEMGPYGKKYYYFNSFEPTLCNVSREFSKYKEDRWEWDNHDITCEIIFECIIYKIKIVKYIIDKLRTDYFCQFWTFLKKSKKITITLEKWKKLLLQNLNLILIFKFWVDLVRNQTG